VGTVQNLKSQLILFFPIGFLVRLGTELSLRQLPEQRELAVTE
jgi:hypothetical protein